jgi:predicted amidohydrolase YtcJ
VTTTLYRNGTVYSPADPFATAMLVVADTVGWVGSEEAADAHASSAEEVVDLDDALVTPAFVDAHAHVTETGLALTGVNLSGARSLAEALSRVEDAARRSSGRPVLGHGWDERGWPEGRPPTMAELDRASYGGSVYLARVDVHSAVVSSALAAATRLRDLDGWTGDGRVERDAHAAARDATRSTLSPARRRDLQRHALQAAAAAGIGVVHEMSAPHIGTADDLRGLLQLVAEERLTEVVPYRGELVGSAERARDLVAALDLPSATPLRGLAGDLCVDGSIGSRTAALRSPYTDAPDTSGYRYLTVDEVRDHLVACTQAGLQAGFHVIGDAGVDVVVEGLRLAAVVVGAPALRRSRHRLEHVEMLDDDGLAVLVSLGVHASVQPVFDSWWGGPDGLYAERLGVDRAAGMNRFADLASAGVPLALSSDSPVTPFAPWEALRACAYHHVADQRISVRAAFLAHTRGACRAAGQDDGGVLAPGSPATCALWSPSDLLVQAPDDRVQAWSTDPRSGTPGLPDLSPGSTPPRCLRTVVRGRVVYDQLDG